MDYESSEAALRRIIDSESKREETTPRNEAQTRLDLIDRLFFECLGWNSEECHVENSHAGSFTDYEFGTPVRQLVVEAKREGISFNLPAGFARPTTPLSQLRRDQAIGAAIKQAMSYGQQRAIPVAVVANGLQLIAFVATRTDGVPPDQGRALVFDSLEAMLSRFEELWNALSKPGLQARRLGRMLDADADRPPPEKVSASIPGYPSYKNRNSLAAELQILGGVFLEDILRQPEVEQSFLEECYVTSGTLSQYAQVSRDVLAARYSHFLESETGASLEPVQHKSGVSGHLLSDVFAASVGQRPVILLGDVGVGKTMFTRRFILVEAREVLKKSIVLYLDFGNEPALADLNPYVLRQFQTQLLIRYGIDIEDNGFVRSVYRSELQRFASGIYKSLREANPEAYALKELELLERCIADLDSHLRRCLEHLLRAQRRETVVFLDNVDQRPFAFQEEVFLISQALAGSWPVACFISLRPETFYRSKRQGSLTGYQTRVFTIEPPRVDRVITRRLTFARKELNATGRLPTFPSNVTVNSERLNQYLGMLLNAFEANEPLIELVDNLSGGNVRRALEFVNAFVGSGHVDSEKIFKALDRYGYTLPLHEFLRAMIYGEHEWYYPADSPIANIWDISQSDGREHFLQPTVISFVERGARSGVDQGFVATSQVYSHCQSLGFNERQTAAALNRCAAADLLETSPRYVGEGVPGADSERCRITSVGAYTVKVLSTEFQYLDAMSVDTPIVDPKWRPLIHSGQSIESRLERADNFRQYLDSQWATFSERGLQFDWSVLSATAAQKMKAVRQGVARTRSD